MLTKIFTDTIDTTWSQGTCFWYNHPFCKKKKKKRKIKELKKLQAVESMNSNLWSLGWNMNWDFIG